MGQAILNGETQGNVELQVTALESVFSKLTLLLSLAVKETETKKGMQNRTFVFVIYLFIMNV